LEVKGSTLKDRRFTENIQNYHQEQQTKNSDHQNDIKPWSPKEESNDIIPMAVKINPQKNLQRLKVLFVQLKTEKFDSKAATEEP
jgi:hypothetical protein